MCPTSVCLQRSCSKYGSTSLWWTQPLLGGDLWQLPPVQDIPIYANPEHKATGERYDAGEQRILSMFWDMHDPKKPDTIQKLYELTVSQRNAGDRWLNVLLSAARDGAETWEMYCFIHDLPTKHTGSWLPSTNLPICGRESCKDCLLYTSPSPRDS